MAPEEKSRLVGYLALALTVAIWSGWIVFTRQAVTQSLPPIVIALCRMVVPAVLLAPVIWRAGIFARGKIIPLIFCVIGAGAPFALLTITSMRYAPSADFGALAPGTMPIIVAAISAIFFKEHLGWLRVLGFFFCGVGVFAIVGNSLIAANSDANFGHALMLSATFIYAGYTIAFRKSGLTPLEATGIVAFWSLLVILPFGFLPTLELARTGHLHEIIFQAVLQGFLSGLVALVAYSVGIDRLGASKGAVFVAMVPVVATLLAIPVLDEWPDMATIIGVVMVSLGVLFASGILAPSEKADQKSAG